jgi:hypothetical protein
MRQALATRIGGQVPKYANTGMARLELAMFYCWRRDMRRPSKGVTEGEPSFSRRVCRRGVLISPARTFLRRTRC